MLDYYMTNIPTLNLVKKLSYHNSYLKYVLLFLGLIVWIIIPIIGIFPLLLFIHFNLNSKKNKISVLNLSILILIAVTTAIFTSSQNIISDTAAYVTRYGDLGQYSPFELAYGKGVEFILPLLSYPIYIISNGSKYSFLFCWSLFINLATIYIAIKLSRENFALILFYTIANPAFFLQIFLIRQFIASIFVLLALVNLESEITTWGFYATSFFTHTTSIMYLPIIIWGIKGTNWIRKLFSIFTNNLVFKILVLLLIISAFAIGIQYNALLNFFKVLSGTDFLYSKSQYWSADNRDTGLGISTTRTVEFLTILLINSFMLQKNHQYSISKNRDLLMSIIFVCLFFLCLITSNIGGYFSLRIGLLLMGFSGIFYYQLLNKKWKIPDLKNIFIVISLIFAFLRFLSFLYNQGKAELYYLNGQAFESSILEYIKLAYESFTNDVQIERFR
jgi:hypothetical protein